MGMQSRLEQEKESFAIVEIIREVGEEREQSKILALVNLQTLT